MKARDGLKYGVSAKWLIPFLFLLLLACVDRIEFEIKQNNSLIVIEGMISDSAEPYTVKVSQAQSLNIDSVVRSPIQNIKIKLYDDEDNSEDLVETEPGVYSTTGKILGKVGHAYHIRLETAEGKIFESEPDSMRPVGKVHEVRYEFEARTIEKAYATLAANVFNIYLDADAGSGNDNYVRWRYTGTYKVSTHPELHATFLQASAYRTPLPCSGYVILPALGGGKLEKVGECTCCICWVNKYEDMPLLSNTELVTNNQFKHVKVAEVPINPNTFNDKFMVQIEQMSLSRTSYDFFKLIRTQKEGAASLFQPPSGEISGNIKAVNSDEAVVGIFWATAISTKNVFIERDAIPYKLVAIDTISDACTRYANSTLQKPKFWE